MSQKSDVLDPDQTVMLNPVVLKRLAAEHLHEGVVEPEKLVKGIKTMRDSLRPLPPSASSTTDAT